MLPSAHPAAICCAKSLRSSFSSRAREAGSDWRQVAGMTTFIAAALAVLAVDLAGGQAVSSASGRRLLPGRPRGGDFPIRIAKDYQRAIGSCLSKRPAVEAPKAEATHARAQMVIASSMLRAQATLSSQTVPLVTIDCNTAAESAPPSKARWNDAPSRRAAKPT